MRISMMRNSRVLISMVALALVALLAACDEPENGGDDAANETDGAAAENGDQENGEEENGEDENGEDENVEMVGDMTWGDEDLEVEFVRCNTAPGEDDPEVIRSVGPALEFHVRYFTEEDNEINRVEFIYGEESAAGDNEMYRAPESEHEKITLEPGAAASGTILLEPNNDLAEAANPDGQELEFELRCGD